MRPWLLKLIPFSGSLDVENCVNRFILTFILYTCPNIVDRVLNRVYMRPRPRLFVS